MDFRHLHDWAVTPREAIAIQQRLRADIRTEGVIDPERLSLVAGVDVSVKNGVSRAAVIVCRLPDFQVVETQIVSRPTPFPYVPGLLTFREGPVLEDAFRALRHEPDVFLVDGAGIAHPRRLGVAAHLGLILDRPTIGCAKTRLCGSHDPVSEERGARAPLIDRGEIVGTVLRTRTRVAPLFVSPGHRCSVESAAAIVLAMAPRFRLPEPIRLAHRHAGRDPDGA